ncbi:hypothetical protein [Streptomyces murinus]|uniref:hypothetical protein n=1 Tax=Streptomyces murinus TaxID=33900 RepID=UPI00382D3BD3
MDPTTKGAIIGACATAVGALIAWLGARAQAKSALQAVQVQVKAQRLDGLWQMRRDAYADFLDTIEVIRTQIGLTIGHAAHQGPASNTAELLDARERLLDSTSAMYHKCTLLSLSVTAAEAANARRFTNTVDGVLRDMDAWIIAVRSGSPEQTELSQRMDRGLRSLRDTIDRFIEDGRSYLQTVHDLSAR